MEESQVEAFLKHLGFTEYEAKAYLTLIIYGQMNAEKLSSASGIPLPRVYDTMNGLAERGLIFVTNTRPQTFKVINPKQLLSLLKEDEKRKMEEKMKKIESIIPKFLDLVSSSYQEKETETEEVIAYIKRKINMEKLWYDLHSEAKQEIFIFAGDLSWIDKTASIVRNTIKRGIKYKILWCKTGKEVTARVKKLIKMGADLRYIDTGELRGVILDKKKVSIVQNVGATEKNVTTIIITNKIITDVFRRYFSQLWERGISPEKFFKEIKIS
jgi:sugar-specific transcriptional regulator TrmB